MRKKHVVGKRVQALFEKMFFEDVKPVAGMSQIVKKHQGRSVVWEMDEKHTVFHTYCIENEETGELKIHQIQKEDCARVEVPILNSIYGKEGIVGTVRFKYWVFNEDKRKWLPVNPSIGIVGALCEHAKAWYRRQGIVLVGKVKSIKDSMFKWSRPDLGTSADWCRLMFEDKLFKEYQRYIGNRVIKHTGDVRVLFYDAAKDVEEVGLLNSDAADGQAYLKDSLFVWLSKNRMEPMDAFGFRIINWKKEDKCILTAKGKADTNLSEFQRICKKYSKDVSDIDLVIPLIDLKVQDNVVDGDVLSIPVESFKWIGYIDPERQHSASLNVVTLSTLLQYAEGIVELLKRHSRVDQDVEMLCKVLQGDLAAYSDLVQRGSNESVNAEVCGLAFPIWKDSKWIMPRLNDYINYLMDRVASYFRKHVRKVHLKGGLNRRASYSRKIEQMNKGNKTGVYIVKLHKQSVYVPFDVMVGRTLGDYDGDNLSGVRLKQGVYLFWRYPVVGPNSFFVGIEKGYSKEDVPEWALCFARAHKKMPVISEPAKEKQELPKSISEAVDSYYNQQLNALANGPLLGQCTNRLIKNDIYRIVNDVIVSHEQIAQESVDIERKAVKAIKSTLDTVGALDYKAIKIDMLKQSLDINDRKYIWYLNGLVFKINKYNVMKVNDIFPAMDYDSVTVDVWNMCSKSAGNSRLLMESVIKATHSVLEQRDDLITKLPVVYCMKEFGNFDPADMVQADRTDVLDMAKVCKYISENRFQLGLDGDAKLIGNIAQDIRDINSISSLHVTKGLNKQALDHLIQLVFRAQSHILNNNVTGEERRRLMVLFGRTTLYACMGCLHLKKDKSFDIQPVLSLFRGVCDENGRWLRSSNLQCGLSNIDDHDLRSFAFSAVASFMRWYMRAKLERYVDRFHCMINIGRTSFVESVNRVASPRLWNICFSAVPKDGEDVEALRSCSDIWINAVLKMNGLEIEPLSIVDDALLSHGAKVSQAFDDGYINEFKHMEDAEEYDLFS